MSLPENAKLATIGENLAVEFLLRNGYNIIARNYHSAYGELDIVAMDGDELAIVEVKTRTATSHDSAESSVTSSKQKKLALTTLQFLSVTPVYAELSCRFDVITVLYSKETDTFNINHLKDAFKPEIQCAH